LDLSWCSIRLLGAKAIAKSIGDNNRLVSLNLSHNRFNNETLDTFAGAFARNMALHELNLRGNELTSRYDRLATQKRSIKNGNQINDPLYHMLVAALTNHTLKVIRVGN
jgi:hypothetical protein